MMNNWFTCNDLCGRWNINKYDLADIVFAGELRGFFNDDFSVLHIVDNSSFVEYPDGRTSSLRHESLLVDEVTKLVFRISDVKEYEKKNRISPRVLSLDPSQHDLSVNVQIKPAQEKTSNSKSIPKPRKAIVLEEAKKLHRDDPNMNKVDAKRYIDNVLKKNHGYNHYGRTQFNRITKDIGFPSAPRGRKPKKIKS